MIIKPMVRDGAEAIGSMGDDTPLAVLVAAAAAALYLLQAALRAGHESADRSDPREARHVAQCRARLAPQPARGDPAARAPHPVHVADPFRE
jgi:hypothetical protein